MAACQPAPTDPGLVQSRRALSSILATVATGTTGLQVKRKSLAFWEPAAMGTSFLAGDWVQSGPNDRARIEFLGGGRLEVDEGALVVIDEQALQDGALAANGRGTEAVLGVESGVIRGVLREPGQSVGIRAPDGSTARLISKPGQGPVEYRLAKRPKGTEVAIRKGAAALTAKNNTRELRAGQAADLAQETVSTVVALLPAPELVAPAGGSNLVLPEGTALSFRWTAVPAAAGYRFQLSRHEEFTDLVDAGEVTAPERGFVPPTEGPLFWRVASRDGDGRLGEFGPPSRLNLARPASEELLLAPEDGARFASRDAAQVTFEWGAAAEGGYQLVVTRGRSLEAAKPSDKVVDEVTLERSARVRLTPGLYSWGVYAVTESEGRRPLFLAPRQLVVGRDDSPPVQVPRSIREWGR